MLVVVLDVVYVLFENCGKKHRGFSHAMATNGDATDSASLGDIEKDSPELEVVQDTISGGIDKMDKDDSPELDARPYTARGVIDKMDKEYSPELDARPYTIKGITDNVDNDKDRKQRPESEDSNENCKSMKFVVYTCLEGQHCGGWGDKQTGVMASFLLAKLMRRKFIIQDKACGVSKFLMPNKHNWKMCQKYISSVPRTRTMTFDFFNNPEEYRALVDNLDPERFPLTQVIFIQTNQLWNDLILSQLEEEDGGASFGKTVSKVSEWVLGMLFKSADNIQAGMIGFRKQVTNSRKLICADIYGNKPDSKLADLIGDTSIHASSINVVSGFLKVFDNPSKYIMYVVSSSKLIREHFDGMFLNVITTDSLIAGIGKSFTENSNPECEKLFTELLEQRILVECDVLLLTNSNLGIMAAYTSEKMQSVFYFIEDGQIIVKITKDEIPNYSNFLKVLGQD